MMFIARPPGKFLSRLGLIVLFAAGVASCAPVARHDTREGWPKPRPLGATMQTYRPVEARATDPAWRATPDEPAGLLTLREALAQALLKNPELAARERIRSRASIARIT